MDDGQSLISKGESLESGGVPGDRPVTYLGEKLMQGEFAEAPFGVKVSHFYMAET